jgi:hypothetical protein
MATTWTTRDGRELLISEMSTQHLANTIAMLERNAERRVRAICRIMCLEEVCSRPVCVAPVTLQRRHRGAVEKRHDEGE